MDSLLGLAYLAITILGPSLCAFAVWTQKERSQEFAFASLAFATSASAIVLRTMLAILMGNWRTGLGFGYREVGFGNYSDFAGFVAFGCSFISVLGIAAGGFLLIVAYRARSSDRGSEGDLGDGFGY